MYSEVQGSSPTFLLRKSSMYVFLSVLYILIFSSPYLAWGTIPSLNNCVTPSNNSVVITPSNS